MLHFSLIKDSYTYFVQLNYNDDLVLFLINSVTQWKVLSVPCNYSTS